MPDVNERLQELLFWKAGLTVELEQLKEGVINFKLFKARGEKFFDRFEGIADADAKRVKRVMVRNSIIVAALAVLLAWPVTRAWQICSDVIEIVDEWHQDHQTINSNKNPDALPAFAPSAGPIDPVAKGGSK